MALSDCAAMDCPVPQECGGEAAPSCAAFLPHLAGRRILDTPVCARCARLRWTAGVTFTPAPGDPDAPCSNCALPLRHAACWWDGESWRTADTEAICDVCRATAAPTEKERRCE